MNKLNDNAKLLAAVALAPIIADFLEDVEHILTPEIRQQHTKNLIYKIRKFDKRMMDNASPETVTGQIDIQTEFRKWLSFNFDHVE